jgi:hypothetical protein
MTLISPVAADPADGRPEPATDGPPDPRQCVVEAANTLKQARVAARTISEPDDRSRRLESIAQQWLALAVAVADRPGLHPLKPDDD